MPLYTYYCEDCTQQFDKLANYNTIVIICSCGGAAVRRSVYTNNSIVAGRTIPAKGDHTNINAEMHKELRKRGWNEDRIYTELRKGIREDPKTGQKSLDTSVLPKEA